MVSNCDLIVGYRTNPHVDMTERCEEAALALRLILAGRADPKSALIRLPIAPAPIALLTADGPYGDLIDYGTRRRAELAGDILNVSIFGGFVFSDSAKNGLAIVVTARHDEAHACALAREIASRCWADRKRFVKTLTSLEILALVEARPDITLPSLAICSMRTASASCRACCGGSSIAAPPPSKKTAHASEQDHADVLAQRAAWRALQPEIDVDRLVFIDETGASTKTARVWPLATRQALRRTYPARPLANNDIRRRPESDQHDRTHGARRCHGRSSVRSLREGGPRTDASARRDRRDGQSARPQARPDPQCN
jgi:Metallopeptidase family M81